MPAYRKSSFRLLGAHVSTAGGLLEMLERARRLGCTCVQIFAGSPRQWRGTPFSLALARACREQALHFGVQKIFIHASYLVNLASPQPGLVSRSLQCVRRDLLSAQRIGAGYVIVHPGSEKGVPGGWQRLRRALRRLGPHIPPQVKILLESMASPPPSLGDLPSLGKLVKVLGPQFGVCLDSAHLYAAGYALDQAGGLRRLVQTVKKHIGFSRIGCLHTNDSKAPCGSGRDRHANLGEGYITGAGFRRLLNHPVFKNIPCVLETPGFNRQGPDRKNLRRLQGYTGTSGVQPGARVL